MCVCVLIPKNLCKNTSYNCAHSTCVSAVFVFVSVCAASLPQPLSLSLPGARHQHNPVSSTLITWFLHNGLAGRDQSLCLPEETSVMQRELHTMRLISIQMSSRPQRGQRGFRRDLRENSTKTQSVRLHDRTSNRTTLHSRLHSRVQACKIDSCSSECLGFT